MSSLTVPLLRDEKTDKPSLTKPLILDDLKTEGVSIFATPDYDSKLRNPKTKLVNGILRRAKKEDTSRFVFSLQTGDNSGVDRSKRKPILVAQRQVCSKFYLFDVSKTRNAKDDMFSDESFKSKDDPRFVGKLERIRRPSRYIGWSLFQGRKEEEAHVASMLYEVPKTLDFLKGKSPFRTAHVVIFSEMPAVDNQGNPIKLENKLAKTLNEHLDKKTTLRDVVAPTEGIHVSSTKHPHKDPKDGVYKLALGGRGRGRSEPENMKLSDFLHKDLFPLQMVSFNEPDVGVDYSLDFAAPFNAFQAFGFALAQFDL